MIVEFNTFEAMSNLALAACSAAVGSAITACCMYYYYRWETFWNLDTLMHAK